MSFERKSMEYLVHRMVGWARGVSSRLTDFRVGSKVRTIIEALALVVEELYDKIFRSLRQLIEDNIYAVLGFDKIPVIYATGTATFARSTPADQNYTILAGTTLTSRASEYSSSVKFYTTADAILALGSSSIDITVVCDQPGVVGNIAAGTLTTFIQKPLGIETVTNALPFTSGAEEETTEDQKVRFQDFFEAQARGVLQSIEYGAKLTKLTDAMTGVVIEAVLQAKALEDLPARKGEVDLYIWNGIGTASSALTSAVMTNLAGYYDSNGNPVYGYKPAGTMVNLYSALTAPVALKVGAVADSTTTLILLKPLIEAEITRYFGELKFGETVVQSELQANIERIAGMYDAKLYLSLDGGTTYSMDNVLPAGTQIATALFPIVYA